MTAHVHVHVAPAPSNTESGTRALWPGAGAHIYPARALICCRYNYGIGFVHSIRGTEVYAHAHSKVRSAGRRVRSRSNVVCTSINLSALSVCL